MSNPEVLAFVIATILSGVQGQITCKRLGFCSCSLSDGSGVIDISSIAHSDGTPAFPDNFATDDYFYSYNPCFGFNEGSCSNVAACQVSGDQSSQYNVGDPTSATFSFDGTNVHIAYTHTDDTGFQRNFDVTLQCDLTADNPTYKSYGEASPGSGQYSSAVTTKCACPNMCGTTPPPQTTVTTTTQSPGNNGGSGGVQEGGLTVGTWLCILFACIVFLYIVAGIIVFIVVFRSGWFPIFDGSLCGKQGYENM